MSPVKSSLVVLLVVSAVLPLFAELKIHEKGNFEIGGLSVFILSVLQIVVKQGNIPSVQ